MNNVDIREFFVEGDDQKTSHVLLHITEPSTAEEIEKGYFLALCEINNLIVESAARGEILSREAVSLIVDADDLMREIDIFLEDFFSRRSRYFKKGENK